MKVGDTVLMKNLVPGNKLTTNFNPSECIVLNKEGSRVTVQNKESNKIYQRNVTHLKRIPDYPSEQEQAVDSTLSEPHVQTSPEPSPMAPSMVNDKLTNPEPSRVQRQVRQPDRLKDFVVGELTEM